MAMRFQVSVPVAMQLIYVRTYTSTKNVNDRGVTKIYTANELACVAADREGFPSPNPLITSPQSPQPPPPNPLPISRYAGYE